MVFRRFALALLLLAAALPLRADSGSRAYKGAIVVDAATGRVLFEDNADIVSPPASMCKLMTFAVLMDQVKAGQIKLTTPITVNRADARVANIKDSTVVWLKEKEVFNVDELIYAMMIQSANDAAFAISHNAAPSTEAFIEMMNAKARSLGMTHSVFRTPNGFPVPSHRVSEGDLTTPRDFSLLCRYLVTQTDIIKYTSVKQKYFGQGVRAVPSLMTNHNHLLGKVPDVDGLKTGFTNGAGFCLSATAERGGHRVIVVMMGCENSKARDLAVTQLLDRGFSSIPFNAPQFTPGAQPAAAQGPISPAPAPLAVPVSPTRPAPAGGSPEIHFAVPGH